MFNFDIRYSTIILTKKPMRILLFLAFILTATISFAQNENQPPPPAQVELTDSAIANKIFERLEIDPVIDPTLWKRHLMATLRKPIEDAANNGMKPGSYTVRVRFVVEKDGTVTDVHATNDPGFGLAKASEDVIKKGPKWKPGEQNGRIVRSYYTQPITYVISKD
jgi:hypothetical protein